MHCPWCVLDCGEAQSEVSDQQLHASGTDHRPDLQTALAGGTVLQMDQTAPAIKAFYGTSENAVKTQIWIAVSVYVLVAIVRKRLGNKTTNGTAQFSNM